MDIQLQATPERIAASITRVVDSQGNSIPNPGTTQDTVMTLSGSGTASSVIFIYDNGVLLTTASVTINGTWSFSPETLVLGPHVFTVRDEPGGVDSPAWVVTVGAMTVPAITRINDSHGTHIPEGDTTFDPDVTIVGAAAPNQKVEVATAYAPHGTADVDGNGNWTFSLLDIAVKSYSITAKALYGNNPVSLPYTFTLARATAPTISSIKDAAGVEIPPNTTTFSASVTLTGTAAAGQQVQIFDGASSLGTVTATGTTWTLALTGLSFKAYSVKAKGLYGTNPESAVRVFTVAVATAPTISSIRDAAGNEIPNDGPLYDNSTVIISGTALANERVELFDYTESAGPINVDIYGNWKFQAWGLRFKTYSLTVTGLYGSNPVSQPPRTFSVQSSSGFENFEAEAEADTVLPLNIPIRCASGLTLKLLIPSADPIHQYVNQLVRATIELNPGFGLVYLMLRIGSLTELQLPGTARQVTFDTWGVDGAGSQVTYFDAAGVAIGSLFIPVGEHGQMVFSAPLGRFIASFQVRMAPVDKGGFAFDNVRWTA